jgi:hypothetical protein
VPAEFKKWFAQNMRDQDIQKKKNSLTSALWRNFIVPPLEHYQKIIEKMDQEYEEKCPCLS